MKIFQACTGHASSLPLSLSLVDGQRRVSSTPILPFPAYPTYTLKQGGEIFIPEPFLRDSPLYLPPLTNGTSGHEVNEPG